MIVLNKQVCCDNFSSFINRTFFIYSDIHNIVPGKYAIFDRKSETKELDKNLIISLLISCKKEFHIICQDEQQRDHIMDAFEVLFGIPLIKLHY